MGGGVICLFISSSVYVAPILESTYNNVGELTYLRWPWGGRWLLLGHNGPQPIWWSPCNGNFHSLDTI